MKSNYHAIFCAMATCCLCVGIWGCDTASTATDPSQQQRLSAASPPKQSVPLPPPERIDAPAPPQPVKHKLPAIHFELIARQIMGAWRKAWEDRDPNAILSLYSPHCDITKGVVRNGSTIYYKLSPEAYRSKLSYLFRQRYDQIRIDIEDIQIVTDREMLISARFLQRFTGFRAGRIQYSDYGVKLFDIHFDGERWLIHKESWTEYSEIPDDLMSGKF